MDKKVLTAQEIENRVNRTVGSFAVDGLILTEDFKEKLRAIDRGEMTHEEAIAELNAKYMNS